MFPDMAASISASVGIGFFFHQRRRGHDLPRWQYPHCGNICLYRGLLHRVRPPSAGRPSMVVMFFPAAVEMGVTQERAASPLMCTVQAPHKAMPHPNFVPVMFSVSRSTQRRGISGLTSTVCGLPFKTKLMGNKPPVVRKRDYPTTIQTSNESASLAWALPVSCPAAPYPEWKAIPLQKSKLRWDRSAGRRRDCRRPGSAGRKSCHFEPTGMSCTASVHPLITPLTGNVAGCPRL